MENHPEMKRYGWMVCEIQYGLDAQPGQPFFITIDIFVESFEAGGTEVSSGMAEVYLTGS